MSQLKNQISKLQSQADKAQHEKKNSKQKNKKKEPKKDYKLAHVVANDQRRTKYATYGGHGDGKHDFDLNIIRKMSSLQYPSVDQQIKAMRDFAAKTAVRDQFDVRLKEATKNNMYLGCKHVWLNNNPLLPTRCGLCSRLQSDMKDEKAIILTPTDDIQKLYDIACKELDMLKTVFREAYKTKPFHIKLWYTAATASSTNTAITTVLTIDPNNSAELASLTALFDIMICDGADIHTAVYSTSPTIPVTATWGDAYDPNNNSTFSSVVGLLPSAYHIGPIRTIGIAASSSPQSVTHTGFFNWSVKIPEEPTLSSTGAANGIYTGDWTDCSNNPAVYGYLKPYVGAGGSSVVLQIERYIGLHMRFKMRT